jgi:REP-associated tyrosine transposase
MARFARVTAVGIPHHVTQRGNARERVFESDPDRLTYLQLLDSQCQQSGVSVLGFCLMSNHVHLVLIPHRAEALGMALRYAHGRYAAYFNARYATSGHLWQGRYYSCPLDTEHLWAALRYTECNPVRARMVDAPDRYRWSSAAVHCGGSVEAVPLRIDLELWRATWNCSTWREFLDQSGRDQETDQLRANTHTGRPLGSPDFVRTLERTLHRTLAAQKGGRPKQQAADSGQTAFVFS